ncbi:MAG TPA: DNA polymerase IV [Levilinea sp.]|nr:DNA polymerase IV [Levilinea sp.]
MKTRKIIHLDLDAFFCAVEELRQPELRGRAFAVGGQVSQRGVISSCSYAARQKGVRSAMPTSQALRMCPELIVLPSTYGAYSQASEQVMGILRNLTPLIEQISIDEAFLDVSDLPQPGIEIARELQTQIRRELNLPCSLGIATNKLVAKMATDVGKSANRGPGYPNSILDVPPGEEEYFLAPLPVRTLWGVGPRMEEHLAEMGIRTIGQLAAVPEPRLVERFGKWGVELALHARGLDDSPVYTEHTVKSISQETTFDRDISDPLVLEQTLRDLTEQVGLRLRQNEFCARTVRLKLRWPDFSTPTRQMTLQQPTDQDGILFAAIQGLFLKLWRPGRAVRLLGVGASGLSPRVHQLTLWETTTAKERRLLEALDELRQRYGKQVIRKGRSMKK